MRIAMLIVTLMCLSHHLVMADHEDDLKVLTSLTEIAQVNENLTRTLGTENVLSEIQSTISLPLVETLNVVNDGLPINTPSHVVDTQEKAVDDTFEHHSEVENTDEARVDANTAVDEQFTTQVPSEFTTSPLVLNSFVEESPLVQQSSDSGIQTESVIEPVVNEIVGDEVAGSVTVEPTTMTTSEEPTTTTTEGPTTTTLPYIPPSTTEEALLNAGSYSDIYFDINSNRAKVVAWKAFQEDINGRITDGNWWIPMKVLSGAAHVVNGVQYEMKVVGGQSNCTQEMNIWDMMPERCSYADGGRRAIFNIITYEKNSRWTDYSPILSRSFSILIREVYPGEDMEQLS